MPRETIIELGPRGAAMNPQERVKIRLRRYIKQLTIGCNKTGCTNPHCASNPGPSREASGVISSLFVLNGRSLSKKNAGRGCGVCHPAYRAENSLLLPNRVDGHHGQPDPSGLRRAN